MYKIEKALNGLGLKTYNSISNVCSFKTDQISSFNLNQSSPVDLDKLEITGKHLQGTDSILCLEN